jgi:hypothetical protein
MEEAFPRRTEGRSSVPVDIVRPLRDGKRQPAQLIKPGGEGGFSSREGEQALRSPKRNPQHSPRPSIAPGVSRNEDRHRERTRVGRTRSTGRIALCQSGEIRIAEAHRADNGAVVEEPQSIQPESLMKIGRGSMLDRPAGGASPPSR